MQPLSFVSTSNVRGSKQFINRVVLSKPINSVGTGVNPVIVEQLHVKTELNNGLTSRESMSVWKPFNAVVVTIITVRGEISNFQGMKILQ